MPIYPMIYLLSINIISIIVTVYDKHCAKHHKWRIPEYTLLILGFFGGALAMFICMKLIRHKTKKKKFMVMLPIFICLQTAFFIWLFGKI